MSVGIERDGARERHAPRHAAGELARARLLRAAQPHRVQLHQHQVVDHRPRAARVCSRIGKATFSNTGEVAEEPALLEHHAHAAAQRRAAPSRVERVDVLAADASTVPARGVSSPPDQLQQRGLARAAGAQDRDHLAARDVEVDALAGPAPAVGEVSPRISTRFFGVSICRLSQNRRPEPAVNSGSKKPGSTMGIVDRVKNILITPEDRVGRDRRGNHAAQQTWSRATCCRSRSSPRSPASSAPRDRALDGPSSAPSACRWGGRSRCWSTSS